MEQAVQHKHKPSLKITARVTLHCLVGCIIGETAGLLIGVSLGLSPQIIILLAVILAYLSGFSLAIWPLIINSQMSLLWSIKIVWIGESISIGVMEFVMNAVAYFIGGVEAESIFTPVFWYGLIVGALFGYLAALPINYWLITRERKACH